MYDFIIIGGGISGLYSAYKIKKENPSASFVVLEKFKRDWLGGRIGNEEFHGETIATGAEYGRKRKDVRLINLLEELNISSPESIRSQNRSKTINNPCNIRSIFLYVKKKYDDKRDRNKTFKDYAIGLLGKDVYEAFLPCSGYTDYENASAYDTLNYYGFDDNYEDWTHLNIPWKKLVLTLQEKIGCKNIHTLTTVTNLEMKGTNNFLITTKDGKTYSGKKVILATTTDTVQKLLPDYSHIYKQIHGQPFLRMYVKISKKSIPLMKYEVFERTVVNGVLQNVIAINPDKGIYMIYSDNNNAMSLKPYIENTSENRKYVARIIENTFALETCTICIKDIMSFYWEIGTHYYEPLSEEFDNREDFIKKAQHPLKNVLVVGEMVSLNQGWVEGALESVETGLTKKWMHS
jgi:hypothetical protein